jgi:16S rRNA (cytosine967-C5)-methyltransferase
MRFYLMRFRPFHLSKIFEVYEAGSLPLDLVVSRYMRANRAIGAKDRRAIGEGVYGVIRWKGLLDHLLKGEGSWAERYELLQRIDPLKVRRKLPPHVQVSCPEPLFNSLVEQWGEKRAQEIALTWNTRAPTTVRANTLKNTREALLQRWQGRYHVHPCALSDVGVLFEERVQLLGSQAYKEGLFELQDEASQLVAQLVEAGPKSHVLDYCAGAGGKSLAIAARMQNRGQLYLHDIRLRSLAEAKKRMKRAGVQNAQIVPAGDPKLARMKGKMDWVLVDAPCSGSGTWRRHPEMKWKFELTQLIDYIKRQRAIFAEALDYLAPKGKIVYATCSLFPEENEKQIEQFCRVHGLQVVGEPFQSLLRAGGPDGLCGAVLSR